VARKLPALTIPTHPDELSPEWLTAALRERGVLREARVVDVRAETLGEGAGFVGTISRLHLTLDPDQAGAPRTLISKLPIASAQNKAVGELGGAYEREIRFYAEVGAGVSIPIPRCYYSARDPNPMSGREEGVVRFMDRWPEWLIRLLLPFFQWLSTKSRRRYVLLLEDLAPARIGDQVAGCSAREAESAVRNAARLHAGFWGRVDGPELSWLPAFWWLKRWMHVAYRRGWPVFESEFGGRFPFMIELAHWLDEHAFELIDRVTAFPTTICHGDYRLDNLSIRDGDPVVFTTFDWQTPVRGPGPFDLAYFIGGNLSREMAAEHEKALVQCYHAELEAHGVRGFGLDECERAYELCKVLIAYRMMLGLDLLDFQNERGVNLIETWMGRLDAILPRDYASLLR
jgi:hypothetical protein